MGEGGEEAAISGDITVTHGAVMGLEWLISETEPGNRNINSLATILTRHHKLIKIFTGLISLREKIIPLT